MEAEEVSRQKRALEMYEKGAASESTGLMRDAIGYYSAALKIHQDVEKIYRKKVHDEIVNQRELEAKMSALALGAGGDPAEEENQIPLDPCWLLDILTDDIIMEICSVLVHIDPRSHVSFSASCRRISELAFSSVVYKHICHQVYPYQVYSSSAIQLNNITTNQELMVKNWDFQWQAMLNDRPFLKYRGLYISRVTYISEGARSTSFYAPIKLVTYFRYLRFYPDGTAIKITTTDEPDLVVPIFSRENIKQFKMGLVARFSIELDGLVTLVRHTADYDFIEEFKIVSLGDRKFHRLQWVSSGTLSKEGERCYYNMSKEKPFNFSGVKSYDVAHD